MVMISFMAEEVWGLYRVRKVLQSPFLVGLFLKRSR